jgi:hypothetical protein
MRNQLTLRVSSPTPPRTVAQTLGVYRRGKKARSHTSLCNNSAGSWPLPCRQSSVHKWACLREHWLVWRWRPDGEAAVATPLTYRTVPLHFFQNLHDT